MSQVCGSCCAPLDRAAWLPAGGALAECLPRSTPFQPARPRSQARGSLLVSAAAQGKGFSEGGGAKAGGSAKAKVRVGG